MQPALIADLISYPYNRFNDFLTLNNNERIIFSGKFGHGKTTFLKHFFEENKGKYNPIFLYPVNYSVSSNEDIFRYIKYDIILEMASNGYPVDNTTNSYLKALPSFLKKNIHKVAASLVLMVPHVGKDIVEIWDRIESLRKEFIQVAREESQSDGDQFAEFLDKLEISDGSIFENDVITNIIQKVLKEKKEKENVLIIDDLDRIDPEHIFRILNVFAAHFERRIDINLKNKFGFDKVIIVCDIDNIRQIFRAKYGIHTDFNGYIDKFSSNYIFKYNNSKAILQVAKEIIFNTAPWDSKTDKTETLNRYFLSGGNDCLSFLLELLIENNQINLRNILKWRTIPYKFSPRLEIHPNVIISVYDYPIIQHLKMLVSIIGDSEGLKTSLDNLRNVISPTFNPYAVHSLTLQCLIILTIGTHKTKLELAHISYTLAGQRLRFSIYPDQKEIYTFQDAASQGIPAPFHLLIEGLNEVISLISTRDFIA